MSTFTKLKKKSCEEQLAVYKYILFDVNSNTVKESEKMQG